MTEDKNEIKLEESGAETLDIEMPEHLAEKIVEIGRREASELDYFSIGLKHIVVEKVKREAG